MVFLNTMYKMVSRIISNAIGRAMMDQEIMLMEEGGGFVNGLELL